MPGLTAWEFLQASEPAELEVFPFLPDIYDVIRGEKSEAINFEGKAPKEIKKATDFIHRSYEEVRLSSLAGVLSELGMETVYSVTEDGRRCLVAMEDEEAILFSYIAVLPSQDVCLVKVEWDENMVLIPETGEVKDAEVYEKLLGNLDVLE
jgi:hypothetical protein